MKKTVRDIDIRGKRILVRVDYNVPLDENRQIGDDSRIRASLPTIRYLIEQQARVILMSHLGRPKGQVKEELRLDVVGTRLSGLLGQKVEVATDCVGPKVQRLVDGLGPGDVLLLENLRFHPEETEGGDEFAQELATMGDVFVNDAFGAAHRAHASVTGIPKHLPAVAGLLMEQEVEQLGGLLEHPARPFAAILGGAKVSDKSGVLRTIIGLVDTLLIGGGMAAPFLKASSYEVGQSPADEENVRIAHDLMDRARESGTRVVLPSDVRVAGELTGHAEPTVVTVDTIPHDQKIGDIGPQTVEQFKRALGDCNTVFWNGPVGIFELAPFAKGTRAIAEFLATLDARTVIGGGETAQAVQEYGLTDRMTFVSTGGGASLEFLSGQELPGVAALEEKQA